MIEYGPGRELLLLAALLAGFFIIRLILRRFGKT